MKPSGSSDTGEGDGGASRFGSVSGPDSPLMSAVSTPGVVFFNSDTFTKQASVVCVPTSGGQRGQRSPGTFFRMAALYKLEDLLPLKTSCSMSTAAAVLPELRNNVREASAQNNLIQRGRSLEAHRDGSAALWRPRSASCSRLRQCSLA